MPFSRFLFAALPGLLAASAMQTAAAQDLADLAARIDYGFHAQDLRVIDAARAQLERLPEGDADVTRVRAFGALRAAQLAPSARAAEPALEECAKLAMPAGAAADDAEMWLLSAACAAVAVQHGFSQQRRRDQALERAAALDRRNPRVALIEAWSLDSRSGAAPDERAAAAAKLGVAVERFRSAAPSGRIALWGEAEALAQLAEIQLERGEIRLARDLVERALLAAADYRFALELQRRLQRASP